MRTDPARSGPRVVIGLFVLALGVLWTLSNLGYLEIESLWQWWPVVLIGIGLSRLLPASGSGRAGGLLLAGVGTLLLLDQLHVWSFDLWEMWPLLLVVVGLTMIWGAVARRGGPSPPGVTSDSWIQAAVIFGGSSRGSNSQEFRGGEATVMLGSCEINLRHAATAEGEAVLDVFVFWGNINIRVPEDWTVTVRASALLGAVADKTRRPAPPTKRLVVKGLAIMGGVEVTN